MRWLQFCVSIIDPYEQKLFNLFKNYEVDGKLSENGLKNLCQTLQLKERLTLLISILYKNGNKTGVSFEEFREGLLHVITSEDGNFSYIYTADFVVSHNLFFLLFFVFYSVIWIHNYLVYVGDGSIFSFLFIYCYVLFGAQVYLLFFFGDFSSCLLFPCLHAVMACSVLKVKIIIFILHTCISA